MVALPNFTDVSRPNLKPAPPYRAEIKTEPATGRPTSVQRTDVSNVPETALPRRLDAEPIMPMLHPERQHSVEAVISMVSATTVFIDCLINNTEVPIKLPAVVVPQELRKFGQPILISLETAGGYRGVHVVARDTPNLVELEGVGEIDSWLAQM